MSPFLLAGAIGVIILALLAALVCIVGGGRGNRMEEDMRKHNMLP